MADNGRLQGGPSCPSVTFPFARISFNSGYPECGGYDANGNSLGIHGTPLEGTSLLHLCVDQDEPGVLQWLLQHGADANAKAAVDADGFGGHTPLFGCVVTAPGMRPDLESRSSFSIAAPIRTRVRRSEKTATSITT